MKNILMIVGSLKKNSFNRQLGREIECMLHGRANVTYLEYAELPFLNQDIEYPVPESVANVRSAVQQADGIWILSPEYNYQIPGVLKNLLDWLSCPMDPCDRHSISAAKGKPVSIASAAGKSAGIGLRKNLKTLLEIMSMKVIGGEGTGYVLDAEAFRSGTLSLSDTERDGLRNHAETFLAAI